MAELSSGSWREILRGVTDYGERLSQRDIGYGPALSFVQKDRKRDEDHRDDPQDCAFAAAFLVSHVEQYNNEPNRASSAVVNSRRAITPLLAGRATRPTVKACSPRSRPTQSRS